MLSKKVDWPILAQCDLFAVKRYVETEFRSAEELVRPLSERIFNKRISTENARKDTFEKLCHAYGSLETDFHIAYDKYEGYRLMYCGKEALAVNTVLRGKPIGFVRPIPDGVTDWSVMRSERTGENLLLVGPIRFVNSDCSPNCDYDFSSITGIVQLKTKKRIFCGQEILVKYGADFFEQNQCRCATCEKITENANLIFSELLTIFIEEFCLKALIESNELCAQPKRKKQRLRRNHLVRLSNDLYAKPKILAPISFTDFDSTEIASDKNNDATFADPFVEVLETNVDSFVAPIQNVEQCALLSDDSRSFILEVPRVSSPCAIFPCALDCSVSAVCAQDSMSLINNEEDAISEKLFAGSVVEVSDACKLLEMLCSKPHLSDEGSTLVFSTVKALLPSDNCLPSGSSFIKKMKSNFESSARALIKVENSCFCVLNFRFQLGDIVCRNFDQIFNYASYRERYPESDLNSNTAPIPKIRNNSVRLSLILSTDGVNIKKSSFKKELWPIWMQIVDLPPILRTACKNTVLAALNVGAETPNWDLIVPLLRGELVSEVEVPVCNEISIFVKFKCILLIADLCAKGHILNMFKFNGFFGCHYCEAEGVTIGRTHAYYPYLQEGKIREPNIHDNYVKYAESFGKIQWPMLWE